MSATHVTRAGQGRSAAGYDDDDTVRRLPSTEPSPGIRPERHPSPPPRRPVVAEGHEEVPVPARRSAHALVLMALEVVDRRRAPQNMRGAFPDHLVEMLRSLSRTGVPGRHLGPARIHRLHMHPAGVGAPTPGRPADREAVDYEVCATYARGPRLFAVAARIRVTPTGASCTALRLV